MRSKGRHEQMTFHEVRKQVQSCLVDLELNLHCTACSVTSQGAMPWSGGIPPTEARLLTLRSPRRRLYRLPWLPRQGNRESTSWLLPGCSHIIDTATSTLCFTCRCAAPSEKPSATEEMQQRRACRSSF